MIVKNLTWNIEGLSRNVFNLVQMLHQEDPSFAFISEPWLHLADAPTALDQHLPQYNYFLNSEDRHDPLLSLARSRAHGGTLAIWKKEIDAYVTVIEPSSSHVLALLLDRPGYRPSVHITVYLSTAGRDADFMKDLVCLQDTIDNVKEEHPGSLIYIRGDANASYIPRRNNQRDELLKYFITDNSFCITNINHKTYHHFMNQGLSDSNIDVLIHPENNKETLEKVLCSKSNALVDSSHDVLVSTCSLPCLPVSEIPCNNITAPKVEHSKHKIVWSEEGIKNYQNLLSRTLPTLELEYADIDLPETASVLFNITNHILTGAAKATNKSIDLGKPLKPRKPFIPPEIRGAMRNKGDALKAIKLAESDPSATTEQIEAAKNLFKETKSIHQNLVRKHNICNEIKRDEELHSLLSKDTRSIFNKFRKTKASQTGKIKSLQVGDKTYSEENIADGFYESISSLKTLPDIASPSFDRFCEDYHHIVEICKDGQKIPLLTEETAEKLLRRIKPGVSDFYSVTAAHYLHGGRVGIRHFLFLINMIIEEVELASIRELNTAHAVVLHKGHGKSRSLSSSYRTISSCPFIAKALDIYLGELSKDDWEGVQAPTQFQGHGSSHDLASLLLTTAIQYSTSSSAPVFVLLLDAKSAFDLVLKEILVRRLFLDTTPDQRIRFWDLRLSNRTTFCQWENNTMGPIYDELGLEQGGPSSSEFYKIYNNEQLSSAQRSGLGTSIAGIAVASVGQADDTALVSNDLHQLQMLLDLSLLYCQKHQVQLSASKTKLLVFSREESTYVKYSKLISPLHMDKTPIPFATTAEHVGVLRSVNGNLPHIHQRMVCHKRALAKILCMGMAKRHRANPLASLRAESIFCTPVLYSGLATLWVNKQETDILSAHVKETISKLLKLYPKTPTPVVFFLAGKLPGEAQLHVKQLTLFGMICRLKDNILNKIAVKLLTVEKQTSKNWFSDIRSLCYTYNLPHPLLLLRYPPSKEDFKYIVKTNITDFWQSKLRQNSKDLEDKSLKYF